MTNDDTSENLLTIRNLYTYFYTYLGVVKALNGVNLEVKKGETVGLTGETGCGKSVTALSIMRLISEAGKVVSGEIIFKGVDLLKLSEEEMRRIRGKEISMVFQEPMSSLNPVFRIGDQLSAPIMLHQGMDRKEAMEKAIEMLRLCKIADAEKIVRSYPHELSGGMRQRVMIAMALSCNPALLIADEPTSFLDVTVQAQVLKLMNELKERMGTSMIMISHDLGVIAQLCNRVAVMYAGDIVEVGDVRPIFKEPTHPYTKGLLRALPGILTRRLFSIKGTIPELIDPPPGCRFSPRCKHSAEICSRQKPQLVEVGEGHRVSCFLYHKESTGED